MLEYIKVVNKNNELVSTDVPIKKDGIYYLSGKENYWIVSSGKIRDLQNPFIEKSIIGLGWDKVTIQEIEENDQENLKELLLRKYFFLEQYYSTTAAFKAYISNVTNKLKRFVCEIKLGDIIVLKDRGSNIIYFGKIISEAEEYEENDLEIDSKVGNCNKVRKVKWLKYSEKEKLGSELKLALTTRHALSLIKLNKVREEINREIFSYFYCGENLHIVFKIELNDNISQDSFKEFLDYIYDLKKDYISSNNIENIFNIKSNIQSPGPVEFYGNPEIAKYIFTVIAGTGIVATAKYLDIKRKLKIKDPRKDDQEIDDGFSRGN